MGLTQEEIGHLGRKIFQHLSNKFPQAGTTNIEDALQTAFLYVSTNHPNSSKERYARIVYCIACRYIYREIERQKKENVYDRNEEDSLQNSYFDVFEKDSSQQLAQEKLLSKLNEALKKLSEQDYELIYCHYWEKMRFKEIGVILGISEAAAQKRHVRIKKKLRQMMGVSPPPAKIVPNSNFVRFFLNRYYIYLGNCKN